jgi:hypothetical protein
VLTVPGKDRILGVTIVGEHAGDLIAEYVLAMKHGIGLNKILGTIHIYPTLAEANKYVAGVWKKAHAPQGLLAWVARFHAWRRGFALWPRHKPATRMRPGTIKPFNNGNARRRLHAQGRACVEGLPHAAVRSSNHSAWPS